MSDDELRRRLRDIPAPRAGIDADGVIAAAKRRRRPKAIALSSAATVASVLIVAPLAVNGLQLLPQSASYEVSSDAGAESAEQPQPGGASEEAQPEGSAADAGDGDTGAAGDAPPTGADDAAASGGSSLVCGLRPASDLGLELVFADDPTDGSAHVEVRGADGAAVPRFEVVEVGSLDSVDGVARVRAGAASEELTLAAGESAELEVRTAVIQPETCDDAAASPLAPVAIVVRGTGTPTAVIGEPWR